ncbi:hypothetical protein ACWOA7_02665 [Gemella morbillorum]|jgi:hypothetical protein
MRKKQLTLEQKKLEWDLTIIGIITFMDFGMYTVYGNQMKGFLTNNSINVISRLLLNAGV